MRRIGAHDFLVPDLHGTRRRPPHLCLSFCSNSSSLLQTASCDASVAGRAWVPTRVSRLSKLLREGKTAAIRVRSCGHHDSLQFFILLSLWADNLFIAVTAFSLTVASVLLLQKSQSTEVRLEGFVSSSPSTFQQRCFSKREYHASSPRIVQSNGSPWVSATRVLGATVMHGTLLGFVVIACRDFSPRTVQR